MTLAGRLYSGTGGRLGSVAGPHGEVSVYVPVPLQPVAFTAGSNTARHSVFSSALR